MANWRQAPKIASIRVSGIVLLTNPGTVHALAPGNPSWRQIGELAYRGITVDWKAQAHHERFGWRIRAIEKLPCMVVFIMSNEKNRLSIVNDASRHECRAVWRLIKMPHT